MLIAEQEWRCVTAAADALMVEFAPQIDLSINAQVHRLARLIEVDGSPLICEVVPSYRSLLIYYDVLHCAEAQVRSLLLPLIGQVLDESVSGALATQAMRGTLHQVEVCYAPDLGLDIVAVADALGGSIDDVIRLHTAPEYHVYTLGFAPQFAYLGDVDERLRLPRHATPRQKVPAGSVAIAGQQTAIYPQISPGGWQILGRTACIPTLKAGDRVRFVAISAHDFAQLQGAQC
mgnify:CR=1 FL=1